MMERRQGEEAPVDPVRKRVLLGVSAVVVLVAIVLSIVALTNDDSEDAASTASTTSTSSTTATSSTTTTAPTTTTTASPQDLDAAVFPDLTGAARYSDPADLVRDFAIQTLGFDQDVHVGPFQATGPGAGQIDLTSSFGGGTTTVSLRQLGDGAWIALGTRTSSIRLDTPISGTAISSPQPLIGAAYAFEGRVNVTLYVDRSDTQIASTFVMGRGDGVLGGFNSQITFQPPPAGTRGILVLSAAGAADGSTAAATTIRVRF
jgi:hypothetical protein